MLVRCDFCSDKNPKYVYNCLSFTARSIFEDAPILYHSIDEWAACETCKILIEANEREMLLQRSWDTFIDNHPESKKHETILKKEIENLHAGFWKFRIGGDEIIG